MEHCNHDNRSVFRNNLEIARTIIECWKDHIQIPTKLVVHTCIHCTVTQTCCTCRVTSFKYTVLVWTPHTHISAFWKGGLYSQTKDNLQGRIFCIQLYTHIIVFENDCSTHTHAHTHTRTHTRTHTHTHARTHTHAHACVHTHTEYRFMCCSRL